MVSNNELQHRSILPVFQRRNSDVLIETDGGAFNSLNQNKDGFDTSIFKHNSKEPNSISGNVVKTIFEDSHNQLWIGLFGKELDLYNPETKPYNISLMKQ